MQMCLSESLFCWFIFLCQISGNIRFLQISTIEISSMVLIFKDIQKETDLTTSDSEESDDSSSSVLSKATISKYFTFFR